MRDKITVITCYSILRLSGQSISKLWVISGGRRFALKEVIIRLECRVRYKRGRANWLGIIYLREDGRGVRAQSLSIARLLNLVVTRFELLNCM